MTEQEKMTLVEEALDVEEGTLLADTVLNDLEEWDSLGTLGLTLSVKDKTGENLTGDIIKGFVTVKDIFDYLG